jgi:DNA uptake protein ComE-like DNA-binding protein
LSSPNRLREEKLDINNASEIELTALPGISIVMAKKLVKKREEIGGFKTVNDVFVFLQIKPHMQAQLEKLICVKKIKGSVKIQLNKERSIDL